MKPKKLVISAFGPFGDIQEIDFEWVGRTGLFLISGDTGAGKTTIFDAISFALFGVASGENRGNASFCSGYADKNASTYVELDFLHQGKQYHIRRNPDYQRSAKRGNRMVVEKRDALLLKPDGEQIINFEKVTDAIEELLGIDWRQFKQISMIAQGEFIKLLTADSGERGKIFRKAFNTQVLEDFQRKLAEQYNGLKKECEDCDKSILQYLDGILTEEWEKDEELKNAKKNKNTEKLEQLLEQLLKEEEKEKERYKEFCQKLEYQLLEKTARKAEAEMEQQKLSQLEGEQQELKVLQGQEVEFLEKEQRAELGKKALYQVNPIVKQNKQVEEQQKKQKIAWEIVNKKLSFLYQRRLLSIHEYEIYKEKEPKIQQLKIKIASYEKQLPSFKEIKIIQEIIEKNKKQIEKCEKIIQEYFNQKEKIEEERRKRQEENLLYGEAEVKREKLIYQLENSQSQKRQIEELLEEYKRQKELAIRLVNLQSIYVKRERLWQESEEKLRDASLLFRQEIAGILAENLQEGVPCPVCGSTTHPHLKKKAQKAPTREELEEIEQRTEMIRQQRDQSLQQCEELKARMDIEYKRWKKNYEVLLENLKDIDNGQKEEKEEKSKWKIGQLKKQKQLLEKDCILLQEEIEKYEQMIKKRKENMRRLTIIQEEYSDIEQKLKETEQKKIN